MQANEYTQNTNCQSLEKQFIYVNICQYESSFSIFFAMLADKAKTWSPRLSGFLLYPMLHGLAPEKERKPSVCVCVRECLDEMLTDRLSGHKQSVCLLVALNSSKYCVRNI